MSKLSSGKTESIIDVDGIAESQVESKNANDGKEMENRKRIFDVSQQTPSNAQLLTASKRPRADLLSQITETSEELRKKIDQFIETKREQNNTSNQIEFSSRLTSEGDSSCARVAVSDIDRASHIRVTHVQHTVAPPTIVENLGKPPVFCIDLTELPDGVEERVQNAEEFLSVKLTSSVPRDVYQRLKAIESRIMELEYKGTLSRARDYEDKKADLIFAMFRTNKKQLVVWSQAAQLEIECQDDTTHKCRLCSPEFVAL